jgi:hypothetical protein
MSAAGRLCETVRLGKASDKFSAPVLAVIDCDWHHSRHAD